ncbi:hypothetical protein RYX36_031786 [Vicia faba]
MNDEIGGLSFGSDFELAADPFCTVCDCKVYLKRLAYMNLGLGAVRNSIRIESNLGLGAVRNSIRIESNLGLGAVRNSIRIESNVTTVVSRS